MSSDISFGGRNLIDEEKTRITAAFAEQRRLEQERIDQLPQVRTEGEAALRRLLPIAQGHSGQCRHVAAFLLGLYNGTRFPFDLTDLRSIDHAIFQDCLAVLRMDANPQREVHTYFDNGGQVFEQLAEDWRIPDRLVLRQVIEAAQIPGAEHLDNVRAARATYLEGQRV